MTDIVLKQNNKIHPHKFALWLGIASIVMMFAGLTSAYIVKGSMPGWSTVVMPVHFYYSTAVILLSSLTVFLAKKSFIGRKMKQYRILITVTAALGLVFVLLQALGFKYLFEHGVTFAGSAGAGQFLYVIFSLHIVHVLGGVVALLVVFVRAFNQKTRFYNVVPIELVGIYWHFVDLLWVYLFIFFLITG